MSTRTPPKTRAGAAILSCLLALLLIAAGAVGIHDLLTGQGWVSGDDWLPLAVDAADGLQVTTPVVVVAVLVGLVGLWLVLVALKPRRTTHTAAPDKELDLWLSRAALGAVARNTADRMPGVASATARTHRRRIDVEVRSDQDANETRQRVGEAVEQRLHGLTKRRVRVRTREVN